MVKPAAFEQVERDLEMTLAILRRAGRRLPEALPKMNGAQREQTQRSIESARRELNRLAERIGKEQETKHAESGAAERDSGAASKGRDQTRDLSRAASIASDRAQSPALQLHKRDGDSVAGDRLSSIFPQPANLELAVEVVDFLTGHGRRQGLRAQGCRPD
jgi:hypothetical protein